MPKFIITYFGGDQPSSPEEGKAHFTKYQQWLADLGEAVVSAMNPLKDAHTIHSDRSIIEQSVAGISGFTVIQADSIDQAVEYAKACPFLDINGTLEVAQRIEMS